MLGLRQVRTCSSHHASAPHGAGPALLFGPPKRPYINLPPKQKPRDSLSSPPPLRERRGRGSPDNAGIVADLCRDVKTVRLCRLPPHAGGGQARGHWLRFAPERSILHRKKEPLGTRRLASKSKAPEQPGASERLIVIGRGDVLHSRLHEVWALDMGTALEDRPRYSLSTTPNLPVNRRLRHRKLPRNLRNRPALSMEPGDFARVHGGPRPPADPSPRSRPL